MSARERLPKMEVQPKLSTLTIANRVPPCSKTIARANKSPRFSLTGCGTPMPPDTGKRGSGVMTRTAAPTRIFCAWTEKLAITNKQRQMKRCIII